jgi:hypothetical protein
LIEVLHGGSPDGGLAAAVAAAASATLSATRARGTPKTLLFRYKSI